MYCMLNCIWVRVEQGTEQKEVQTGWLISLIKEQINMTTNSVVVMVVRR